MRTLPRSLIVLFSLLLGLIAFPLSASATSGWQNWSYSADFGGYVAVIHGNYQIQGSGTYVTQFAGNALDTNYWPAVGGHFRYCNNVTGCGPWINLYMPGGQWVGMNRPQNRYYPVSTECQQFQIGGLPIVQRCASIY